MSRFWSDVVHRLTPYVPGEQPQQSGLIKLNTNESPYGPSPAVLDAIRAEVSDGLRLYPDPEASRLKQAVADSYGLSPDQVFPGNGSDEILALTFQALLNHNEAVLFPDISYSFYPVYCRLYEIDYRPVPIAADFSLPVADFCPPNGGIVLANPNAPTGLALGLADVETILRANPDSVVVVDEAYVDFGAQSAVALIDRYPNLLVIHTLSKSRALAGLRVGFAMGHPDLITALKRVKNSFNSYPLDRMAIAGAVAALQDRAYFQQLCDKVIASREYLSDALRALGFSVIPSTANFIFTTHPNHDALTLQARLREHKIIVRHFALPRIDQYLRISIGTDDECKRLIDVLQTLCG